MTEDQTAYVLAQLDAATIAISTVRGFALGGHSVRERVADIANNLGEVVDYIDRAESVYADTALRPMLNKYATIADGEA